MLYTDLITVITFTITVRLRAPSTHRTRLSTSISIPPSLSDSVLRQPVTPTQPTPSPSPPQPSPSHSVLRQPNNHITASSIFVTANSITVTTPAIKVRLRAPSAHRPCHCHLHLRHHPRHHRQPACTVSLVTLSLPPPSPSPPQQSPSDSVLRQPIDPVTATSISVTPPAITVRFCAPSAL